MIPPRALKVLVWCAIIALLASGVAVALTVASSASPPPHSYTRVDTKDLDLLRLELRLWGMGVAVTVLLASAGIIWKAGNLYRDLINRVTALEKWDSRVEGRLNQHSDQLRATDQDLQLLKQLAEERSKARANESSQLVQEIHDIKGMLGNHRGS